MDRNTGLIATIVAAVLCGCPGLFSCFMGTLFAVISFVPDADIDVFGSSDPTSALLFGLGTMCGGLIFIAIPVALWFFLVKGKAANSV